MDPFDFAAVDGVRDLVQRVANDSVAPLHAGGLQRFDQYVGDSFAHSGTSRVSCHVCRLTSRHGDRQQGELDGAQPRREENLTACAAKILLTLNLKTLNAAIHSTLDVQDAVMVEL